MDSLQLAMVVVSLEKISQPSKKLSLFCFFWGGDEVPPFGGQKLRFFLATIIGCPSRISSQKMVSLL